MSALQRRNDLERELDRDYSAREQILGGIVAILEEAYRVIDETPRKAWSDDKVAAYFESVSWATEFEHIYQALDRLPLHTIPWWQISRSALEMQSAVRDCKKGLLPLESGFVNRNASFPRKPWRHHLDRIEECFNHADAAIGVVRSMELAIRRKPSLPAQND
ncbi:hypothetical protein G3N96_04295 [Burkholderia sp. Se-20373]|uniref:hypothetical protein n=1 Tax=Burkholderia sp. Se-20373 TaxID=2703898 RepID=UPI00197E5EF9|nr:hypothetical protein [Burkholderia sp. Se-20373]MBN3744656.1 hypothetical protein [Burkholderia sp. Se-20373]